MITWLIIIVVWVVLVAILGKPLGDYMRRREDAETKKEEDRVREIANEVNVMEREHLQMC